jgi:hypothetical protein
MRRSFVIAALALAGLALLAGPGLAVGPQPPADQQRARLVDADGTAYVVQPGNTTSIQAVRNGTVAGHMQLTGMYGVPLITITGTHAGLSPDSRTLVLASVDLTGAATATSFAVIPTSLTQPARIITLHGNWTFDAISPNGRVMYLIQRLPGGTLEKYRVRSYDLAANRLSTHVIADRDDPHGMAGYPVSRAVKGHGRLVFTLYANLNGTSFVHALNAARGTAHCIDLPWHLTGDAMGTLWGLHLALSSDQRSLRVIGANGTVARVDTGSLKVVHAVKAP